MNRREYEYIQERLTNKLKHWNKSSLTTHKEDAYNKGILAAKSIIKEIYERQEN